MDNIVELILYDDTATNFDYFSTLIRDDDDKNEKKLLIAVFLSSMIDFYSKNTERKRDASRWFFKESDPNWAFSFENICFFLKFNKENIRKQLLELKNSPDLPKIVKKLKHLNPTTGTRNKIR